MSAVTNGGSLSLRSYEQTSRENRFINDKRAGWRLTSIHFLPTSCTVPSVGRGSPRRLRLPSEHIPRPSPSFQTGRLLTDRGSLTGTLICVSIPSRFSSLLQALSWVDSCRPPTIDMLQYNPPGPPECDRMLLNLHWGPHLDKPIAN